MNPRILAKRRPCLAPGIPVSVDAEKRSVSYRLPADLIRAIEEEAIAEGRARQSGRAFNPSAVIERVMRAYFNAKPPKSRGRK